MGDPELCHPAAPGAARSPLDTSTPPLTCYSLVVTSDADNRRSENSAVGALHAPPDVTSRGRLYSIEEAGWLKPGPDIAYPLVCSNAYCDTPAAYYRWTGTRWWKLCTEHLVPHLRRQSEEPPTRR
jgi:hypothetical protein